MNRTLLSGMTLTLYFSLAHVCDAQEIGKDMGRGAVTVAQSVSVIAPPEPERDLSNPGVIVCPFTHCSADETLYMQKIAELYIGPANRPITGFYTCASSFPAQSDDTRTGILAFTGKVAAFIDLQRRCQLYLDAANK
jgi:hypothetical protein